MLYLYNFCTGVKIYWTFYLQSLITNAAKRYPPGCHFDADFTTPESLPPDGNVAELLSDTNREAPTMTGVTLAKGQAFGKFNLGSTIVLVFEAPAEFEFSIGLNQRVVYGQGIGSVMISEE